MSLAKLLVAPAILAALAVAVPASAAPYQTNGNALRNDIAQLETRLDRLDNTRRISGREEDRLDRSIAGLKRTWSAYSRGGFSQAERRNLSAQIIRVQRDLDRQANDRNDRGRNRGW